MSKPSCSHGDHNAADSKDAGALSTDSHDTEIEINVVKPLNLNEELYKNHFRVAIFGSARIKPGDAIYEQTFELAKWIGQHGWDVITGGGPGLMDAGNAGHEAGDLEKHSDSIGLTIELPWEAQGNRHLEIRKHFDKFSGRLDHFMALSNVVVVMPGGIGTCLELFYTWQLTQVKHICPIPIIVVGDMWAKLIDWIKEYPLADGLISPGDITNVHVVSTNEEAFELIQEAHDILKEQGKNACLNLTKYRIEE